MVLRARWLGPVYLWGGPVYFSGGPVYFWGGPAYFWCGPTFGVVLPTSLLGWSCLLFWGSPIYFLLWSYFWGSPAYLWCGPRSCLLWRRTRRQEQGGEDHEEAEPGTLSSRKAGGAGGEASSRRVRQRQVRRAGKASIGTARADSFRPGSSIRRVRQPDAGPPPEAGSPGQEAGFHSRRRTHVQH